MKSIHSDIQEVLLNKEQLQARIEELGKQITEDYSGNDIILVCVLKGSVVFTSDLARSIDLFCDIGFMKASSYGSGTESSGKVTIKLDLTEPIKGKHVIVIEDILDSGNTLYHIKKLLAEREPASLKICTLLNKAERREAPIEADYVGFNVPNAFVVGFGLDFNEKYRNLPYVGILKPEVYKD